MRLWTLAMLLVGCEDTGFTYVGPNEEATQAALDTAMNLGSGTACSQVSSQGLCTEFVGASYSVEEIQGNCAGGTVQEGCTLDDVLGVCGLQVGTVFETRTYYYQGSFFTTTNIDSAESTCVLKGGEWL